MKPALNSFDSYFHYYVSLVKDIPLIDAFTHNDKLIEEIYDKLTEQQGNYRYAAGKWSVKELLIHLIDTETIFNYRALTFARKDHTSLPGYNHNEYITTSNADELTISELIETYRSLRSYTKLLFMGFNDEMLSNSGTAGEKTLTVGAIGYLIIGHEIHHTNVLLEKYLMNE